MTHGYHQTMQLVFSAANKTRMKYGLTIFQLSWFKFCEYGEVPFLDNGVNNELYNNELYNYTVNYFNDVFFGKTREHRFDDMSDIEIATWRIVFNSFITDTRNDYMSMVCHDAIHYMTMSDTSEHDEGKIANRQYYGRYYLPNSERLITILINDDKSFDLLVNPRRIWG